MGLTWRGCVLPWRHQSCDNNRISPRWGLAFAGHSFRRAMPCAVDGRLSKNVFTKYKGNALSSEEFADFINKNGEDILNVSLYNYKAWFHLSGRVNTKNTRLWCTENSLAVVESRYTWPKFTFVWRFQEGISLAQYFFLLKQLILSVIVRKFFSIYRQCKRRRN